MTLEKKPQLNQSSEKLFSILELMANSEAPMRLLDISKKLNINNSTTLRFLNTMIKCGYVLQEPESLRYYLTYKICNIANKISAKTDLRTLILPYLKNISEHFGESVCLSVDQGMKVVYIDVVDGPDKMIKSMQRIGNVAPLHSTAAGKLFLTEYLPNHMDNFVKNVGLPILTKNTITSEMKLSKELSLIKEKGYALDNEECELGARCVACPIYDYTGRIIAAISVTGPISRMSMDFISNNINYLKETSFIVSELLGYELPIKN